MHMPSMIFALALLVMLVLLALDWLLPKDRPLGVFRGRCSVRDANAFTFRMGNSSLGTVNRISNAKIEPCLVDTSAPPTGFGQPVVVDATTQGVRPLAAGDTALDAIYGFTVRPFPFQQGSTTNFGSASFGGESPPTNQTVDVLRSGYITALMSNPGSAAVKGGRVYIWIAASTGAHVQGGLETAASGSNTIELDEKTYFNGPADANNLVEVSFNI